MNNAIKTVLTISLITTILILLLELGSYLVLRFQEKDPEFLYTRIDSDARDLGRGAKYRLLDPHLGYALPSEGHPKTERVMKEFTWINGFVLYTKNSQDLKPPIILTLGGSTTDGAVAGHSWPEELSKLLSLNGLSGTVINGGTGGYSTNQELLKLIRDGLEFKPDIVISYSGVNDRGTYSQLPHPMVHTHQVRILDVITGEVPSRFLPSTVALLRTLVDATSKDGGVGYTLGVESSLSLGAQYRRNLELMNSVTVTMGGTFFGFVQPCRFCQRDSRASGIPYREKVVSLYREIRSLPAELDYVYDATHVLDGNEDVYGGDGVHVSPRGNELIAAYVFEKIRPVVEDSKGSYD